MEDEIDNDLTYYYGISDNNNFNKSANTYSNNIKNNNILEKVLFKVPSINDKENLYLTYKEIYHLAKIMHETLFEYYPSLKKWFEYFISICLVFTKLDLPILWYPPSGLSICQRYLKTAKSKVSISVGHGKKKTVLLNKKTI